MTRTGTDRGTPATIAVTGALVATAASAEHTASGQACSARLVFPA